MALVVAFVLAAVCGAFSASLPALPDLSVPEVLDTALDTALDALGSEKVRRSVLDEVKQLLDTQISALLEDGVKQIAGKKGVLKRRAKPNRRSRPPLIHVDKADPLESTSQEISHNSELIKVLTDGSLQDPADIALRNSVDELLQEDEDKIIEQDKSNNEDVTVDSNERYRAAVEKPTKSYNDETENNEDINPITSETITYEKHKHGSTKSHSKDVNHVTIEHSSKNHDDIETLESIVDLDEILKSRLKDLSDSLSDEDNDVGNDIIHEIKTKHEEDSEHDEKMNTKREHVYEESRERIKNISENNHKIDKSNNRQTDKVSHIDVDENELQIGKSRSNQNDDKLVNIISSEEYVSDKKANEVDENIISSEEYISDKKANEVDENIISSEEYISDKKANEVDENHLKKEPTDEKIKHKYDKNINHRTKTHRSKHHRHGKHTRHHQHKHHKKNDRHAQAKFHNSKAKNDPRIYVEDDKDQDHDKTLISELKIQGQEQNKQTTDNDDNRTSLISTQSVFTSKIENDTQEKIKEIINADDVEDKGNKATYMNAVEKNITKEKMPVTRKKDLAGDKNVISIESENAFDEDSIVTHKKENFSVEETNSTDEERNLIKEKGGNIARKAKHVTKEEDDVTEKENNGTNEDKNASKETKTETFEENNVILERKNVVTEEGNSDNEEKKYKTEEHKTKEDKKHTCHHKKNHEGNGISPQSAESDKINDLIHNKEMTKSYTISLTFTSK